MSADPYRIFAISVLCCMALLFPTMAWSQPSAFQPNDAKPEWMQPIPDEKEVEDSIERFIALQPLTAKIMQLMLVTLEGATHPSAADLAFLKETVPGGVIVPHAFKPSMAAQYIEVLRKFEAAPHLPLFIGADLYRLAQPVRTTPMDYIQLPLPLALAAADHETSTHKLGQLMAEYMRAMGFNLHLGPSLELAPTLERAQTGLYTFGGSPEFTAKTARIIFNAFLDVGIVALPMGFPGGGANRIVQGAAVLLTAPETLENTDTYPYLAALHEGMEMIHVGNTLVPTLDIDNRPASMAAVVMNNMLRGKIQFTGIILAGPLDDDIIQARYTSTDAAVMSFMAGADMLYWANGLLSPVRAAEALEHMVKIGRITESRIDESLRRILSVKQKITVPKKPVSAAQADKLNRQKQFQEYTREIERRAITLLQNQGNALPLIDKVSTPVGITGVAGVEELHGLLEKKLKPVVQQRITTARHVGEIQRFEIERLTRHMQGLRTIICILTEDIRKETQVELLRALRTKGTQLIVIHLGYPADAAHLIMADSLLLAYCHPVMAAQTMAALADILIGEAPISFAPLPQPILMKKGETRTFNAYEILRAPSGKLPVSISDRFPAGSAVAYNPEHAIKRVEWDFSGKRIRKPSTTFRFDAPGEYTVTCTVTDCRNEVSSNSYVIVVSE